MSLAISCRLFGQSAALVMHSVNSISMLIAMYDEELTKDPKIKTMISLQSRYLTVWNIGFQLTYFFIAFLCDIFTVIGKDHMIPKSIRSFRQVFFASIMWPVTMIVFTIFWGFFLTNRDLLFPEYIDKIFSFRNNLVMHFWIFVVAVWELLFWPRNMPKSHSKNLVITSSLLVFYLITLLHSYSQRGKWPYPIMALTFGTIYFPIFALSVYMLCIAFYFLQWKLTPKLQENPKRNSKKLK